MNKKTLFFLLVLLSFRTLAETLIVGLPEPGRKPFFWLDSQNVPAGSYIALLTKISDMIGADIKFRMVPQARLLKEFDGDKVSIEPGVAQEWRPSAHDVEFSRYTKPFMKMTDVLIYRKGLPITSGTSPSLMLKQPGLRIGQVRGFHAPEGLRITLLNNELDIARLVHAGALDIGFMNESVAIDLKTTHRFSYEISGPLASTPVSFRFHRVHEKWVTPFNGAIDQLARTGELHRILANAAKHAP